MRLSQLAQFPNITQTTGEVILLVCWAAVVIFFIMSVKEKLPLSGAIFFILILGGVFMYLYLWTGY